MKLLVVGGAGFLGSNFVRHILTEKHDWHIKVIDILAFPELIKNLDGLDSKTFSFTQGDICNPASLDSLVAECDVVVNFADESRDIRILQSTWPLVYTNILGPYYLLEAVKKHNKRLHHISTDKVFGDLPATGQDKFTENTPYRPYTPYAASKAGADQMIRAWSWSLNSQATISISSSCYGPYQRVDKFLARQITDVLSGQTPKLYGTGENVRDWLHVDDCSSAIMTILEKGKSGETYLIGANVQKANKEITELVLETMGKGVNEYLPINDKLPHDQRRAIDPTKISSELGWQPMYTDLGVGLAQTIKWYTENQPWWQPQKSIVENQLSQLEA